MELSIVMPCLNEAETVATCVAKARGFLDATGIDGEVLIADNGSTDGSQDLARTAGAIVITAPDKGYGAALQAGISAARGTFVIMGDADDSYDFTALEPFVDALRRGADLVMGNRFRGGIAPGAMPALHRYIGNPVLSGIGRLFFPSPIRDFHCGLRGFRRQAIVDLQLQSTGMEFASEMVVKATLASLQVAEVPTTLAKDGRTRPPHLRSWRDGWRHLRFLLLFSPRWLFLIPGIMLMIVGLVIGAVVTIGPVSLGTVTFDVDTLVVAAAMVVIGFQAALFAVFTRTFAVMQGFLPPSTRLTKVMRLFSLEKGLLVGGFLLVAGMAGLIVGFAHWSGAKFGDLDAQNELRLVIPSALALTLGSQVALGSLFLSILGIRHHAKPEITSESLDSV